MQSKGVYRSATRKVEMGNNKAGECLLEYCPLALWAGGLPRFADIFPISKALLNQTFGNEPSPLHFTFQAAFYNE